MPDISGAARVSSIVDRIASTRPPLTRPGFATTHARPQPSVSRPPTPARCRPPTSPVLNPASRHLQRPPLRDHGRPPVRQDPCPIQPRARAPRPKLAHDVRQTSQFALRCSPAGRWCCHRLALARSRATNHEPPRTPTSASWLLHSVPTPQPLRRLRPFGCTPRARSQAGSAAS